MSTGHRRVLREGAVVSLALLVALAIGACTPHPVGPARTSADFEAKARTTAESARSAIETARLVARSATDGRAFGPYVSVMLSRQEDGLRGLAGTFASIQPPNESSDRVRDDLAALLSEAEDHLADVRIAARRGDLDALERVAAPLADDSSALASFLAEHGG